MEAGDVDRDRLDRYVYYLSHRLSHSDGPGSRTLPLWDRHAPRRPGHRSLAIRRQTLGRARWRSEFTSVRTHEVDYNHCAGALLRGSAHGLPDAGRPSEGWHFDPDSGRFDLEAARLGNRHGPRSRRIGRDISCGRQLEACGRGPRDHRFDGPRRLAHAAPFETVPAAAHSNLP